MMFQPLDKDRAGIYEWMIGHNHGLFNFFRCWQVFPNAYKDADAAAGALASTPRRDWGQFFKTNMDQAKFERLVDDYDKGLVR